MTFVVSDLGLWVRDGDVEKTPHGRNPQREGTCGGSLTITLYSFTEQLLPGIVPCIMGTVHRVYWTVGGHITPPSARDSVRAEMYGRISIK